jgi:hypothetical protein
MFSIESKGSFSRTNAFLSRLSGQKLYARLDAYGQEGVSALASATPQNEGLTAASWTYDIEMGPSSYSIVWKNTNMAGNTPVVILLTYGHGTGTGGYVEGRNFVNEAIQPVFDRILADVRKAVASA